MLPLPSFLETPHLLTLSSCCTGLRRRLLLEVRRLRLLLGWEALPLEFLLSLQNVQILQFEGFSKDSVLPLAAWPHLVDVHFHCADNAGLDAFVTNTVKAPLVHMALVHVLGKARLRPGLLWSAYNIFPRAAVLGLVGGGREAVTEIAGCMMSRTSFLEGVHVAPRARLTDVEDLAYALEHAKALQFVSLSLDTSRNLLLRLLCSLRKSVRSVMLYRMHCCDAVVRWLRLWTAAGLRLKTLNLKEMRVEGKGIVRNAARLGRALEAARPESWKVTTLSVEFDKSFQTILAKLGAQRTIEFL